MGPSRALPCVSLSPRACTFPGDSVTTGFWAAEPGGKVAPASCRRTYSPSVSGRSGDRGKPCPPPGGARSVRTVVRLVRTARSARRPRLAFRRGPPRSRLLGSVAKLAPHPTRLETRTKESNMCASHWACTNPKGEVKAKAPSRWAEVRSGLALGRSAQHRPVSWVTSLRRS